ISLVTNLAGAGTCATLDHKAGKGLETEIKHKRRVKTIGFAMYFYKFDPWIGKLLQLEDFYVNEGYQGLGIGAAMLKKLSQIAIDTQCSAMQFLVVIWNQDSIEYYTRLGAVDLSSEEGWHLFRFNMDDLLELAEEE
ncbi:hypothetical protein A6R68_17512, partial [Neotoma lepida]